MRGGQAARSLEAICAKQAGLVTAAQARAVGVAGADLARLVRDGALESVERGTYLLAGCDWPIHLEIRVAWLRLDPAALPGARDGLGADDGVVSHRSACLLFELGDIPAPATELTVPRCRRTRVPHVRLRVCSDLPAQQVAVVEGLPVTTPARTIVDLLRDSADGGHVGGVVADAANRGLIRLDRLAPHVERFASRYAMPGADGLELLEMLIAMSVPT